MRTYAAAFHRSEDETMPQKSLEDRIRDIEDRLEILNLVASHPPGADTGSDDFSRRTGSRTA